MFYKVFGFRPLGISVLLFLIITELADERDQQDEEIKKLKLQRTDTSLKLENKELRQQVEVLLEENLTLKEMVRKERDPEITTEGDLGTCLPDLIEDKSNNNRFRTYSE